MCAWGNEPSEMGRLGGVSNSDRVVVSIFHERLRNECQSGFESMPGFNSVHSVCREGWQRIHCNYIPHKVVQQTLGDSMNGYVKEMI